MTPPRLRAALLPAVLLLAPASAARGGDLPLDATTRDFDQVHLTVQVTPRIAEGVVDGEATLSFLSLADPLKVLRLHCEETEVLGASDGKGRALEFAVKGGVLEVRLADPLPRGAAEEVTVRYRSRPTAGLFFHAPTEEHPDTPLHLYSQGEGTDNRRWFPCYDEPDDRLTCTVIARVPNDLRTVSNGTLVESRALEGGLREDTWRLDQRIPTYLVSLIVGRYETTTAEAAGVRLEYNGPPGRAAEVRNGYERTPAMMAFFTDWIGHPFPYPRYAQTTVWDFVYGGMENASATTMNMRLLHPAEARPNYSSDGLVAHELAHQWFGDLLTCRTWAHIWLNEGFATYFTDLFFEHADGPEEFALRRRRQNRDYMDGTKHPERLGLKASPRGDQPLELFGGKQYSRGAAVLHQLRLELGDEAFRAGIRRYVRENADSAVTSEDLRRSVEAAAGRDLRWFFDQWVYGAGYPVLEVSWKAEANAVRITVDQVQPAGSGQREEFRLTVPVRFGAGEDAVAARFEVRRRHQEFTLPVPSATLATLGTTRRSFLRFGDGGGTFARVRLKQSRGAWSDALASDPDPTGRVDSLEALADWPDESVAEIAATLATDPVYGVREAAARVLGGIGGAESLEALLLATRDPDGRVREAAAEALGGRTREEAGAALAALARADPLHYVRSAAARSLGRVHAAGAYELLVSLLEVDSHRETIRQGALEGLRALGDRRAIPLAERLLAYNWPRGDHHGMREAALDLLLDLAPDEPGTHAAVVRLLSDPYHRTRAAACRAAGDYAVRSAEARLRELAEKDPFGSVKAAAKAALEKVAPAKGK